MNRTPGGMSDLTIPEYDAPPHHPLCPRFNSEPANPTDDCICGVMKILRDLADEVMMIAVKRGKPRINRKE